MTSPHIDIRALARLSRLDITDAEVAKLETEIPGILGFVEQIQSVVADLPKAVSPEHRTIMRADEVSHESGAHTEDILAAAPTRDGNRIAVKQVISRTK